MNRLKKLKTRVLLPLMACVLLLGVLAGCSKDSGTGEVTVLPSEMLTEVLAGATDVKDSLMDLTQPQIDEFFGIGTEVKYEGAVKISMMNVKSNEVGIFKVEKPEDVQAIEAGIKKRIDAAIAGWMPGYMPEEITKMEEYTVKANGNYVIYVVADEESKTSILTAFDNYFK